MFNSHLNTQDVTEASKYLGAKDIYLGGESSKYFLNGFGVSVY